ncbi:MAG TPA: hypothetical protein VD947_00385 [Patescibacteria group bacterium]|nr:hypothetical protein [Patescibacteria group bacterium]
MTSRRGVEEREPIDATGIVANCWWQVGTEKGPQIFGKRNGLDPSAQRVTAAGMDADGDRIVLHVRQSDSHSSVRIGNVDTRAAAVLHLSGGEVDTEAVLTAGTDLNRLADLDRVTEQPVEATLQSVTIDLQSV